MAEKKTSELLDNTPALITSRNLSKLLIISTTSYLTTSGLPRVSTNNFYDVDIGRYRAYVRREGRKLIELSQTRRKIPM